MLENLALRQQLSTVLQKRRPRIGLVDRAFWVVLRRVGARCWSGSPRSADRPAGMSAHAQHLGALGASTPRMLLVFRSPALGGSSNGEPP
jgi:hypothetical protein